MLLVINQSTLADIEGLESKFRIQQARCEYDTGTFTCMADNRYNEGKKLLSLFVKCKLRRKSHEARLQLKAYEPSPCCICFRVT